MSPGRVAKPVDWLSRVCFGLSLYDWHHERAPQRSHEIVDIACSVRSAAASQVAKWVSLLPVCSLLRRQQGTARRLSAGQHRARKARSARQHPAVLTRKIRQAPTVQALLRTHRNHEKMNSIHLSAYWSSLGHLMRERPAERCWLQGNTEAPNLLVENTVQSAMEGELRSALLANVAYGAARSYRGRSLRTLFAALADAAETQMEDLQPRELSSIAWAFATTGQLDEALAAAFARAAQRRVSEFSPKELANIAWVFATAGGSDGPLFASLASAAEGSMGDFACEDLARTAWAFAVANLYSDRLFGPLFAERCEAATWTNLQVALSQLHQWVLWHQELELPEPFSDSLRSRCLAAFRAGQSTPSHMQREVAATLADLGLHAEQETVTGEGYSIDLLVLWEGKLVAIEFDGPSHFCGRSEGDLPTGATLLKRRQLRAFGWSLVSVPYWEWEELKGKEQRREYLLKLLQSTGPASREDATC
eukprot:gnl/TRDRNA2_/TRDRNA2_163461_c0_seq1.p1 gnl/TRDRNA2_/TRDRNA2_163461_c0~~gnl/TRDRNA2_/TRDRNA2_163461_c0_seq1.p1  ORF type:complete len:478 (-),score=57.39 gnl/TRDRNA2_/TRDRNA2_163461_c0_seq1:78-1511(-)